MVWLEKWASASGMWLIALAVGIALQGTIAGWLVAWRTARGDNLVTRYRGTISRAVGLAIPAFASPLLLPGWAAAPGLAIVASVASVVGTVAFAFPLTVPLGYAGCGASITTGVALSVLALLRSAGLPVPFSWVVPTGAVVFAFSTVAGVWMGWAIGDAPAGMIEGAPGRLKESVGAVASKTGPLEQQVLRYTLPGGIMLMIVVAIWAGLTSHQTIIWPYLVVMSPAALVAAWIGMRRLMSFWAHAMLAVYRLQLVPVTMVRDMVKGSVLPGMILAHYPKALCDTCLRWSKPLESHYEVGVRTCEKCEGEISYEGGPGRLVVLVGEEYAPAELPKRVFVRLSTQITEWEGQLDITHVRLSKNMDHVRDFESLVTWLLNEPPSHGLKKVAVFSPVSRGTLPVNVQNLVENTLMWAESDPLVVAHAEAR